MAIADVMKKVKDNNVKFVDFRFTDTRGKEQHVSVPVSAFDESKFNNFTLEEFLIDGGSQLFFGCMKEDYIGIPGLFSAG